MLIIAVHQSSADGWAAHGVHTQRVRPTELLARDFDPLLTQLDAGRFSAVWIDLLEPRLFTGAGRYVRVWAKLRVLIGVATRAGLPVAIAGCRHKAWQSDQIRHLREEGCLTESLHRWCALGVRVAPHATTPSSVATTILSRPQLPSHPCQCGEAIEHTFGLDRAHEPCQRGLRAIAERAVVVELVRRLGLVVATPRRRGSHPGSSSTPDLLKFISYDVSSNTCV